MLAASRFTSHSHGPGSVSSKSLIANTRLRSAEANTPKFARCASPHACTDSPVTGVPARSAAITAADPRRNANGLASIRAWRMGTSDASRVFACASSTATGSARAAAGR